MTMNTNVTEDGIEIVTPPCELLDVPIGLENLTCTVKGCGRVVSNTSALRLHLLKSHRIGEALEESNKNRVYACPVQGCSRNASSPRKKFFKVMYLLKRHYLLIHAEKKHACEKCGKKFGTAFSTIKHEETCRKFFYCSCGVYYTTKNSLRTHLLKQDDTHKAVPDPTDEQQKQKTVLLKDDTRQTVSVPCFLYIPKSNTTSSTQDKPNFHQNSTQPQLNNNRYIRILPKNKQPEPVTEPVQFIDPASLMKYCNSFNVGDLFQKAPKLTNIEPKEITALHTLKPQQASTENEVVERKAKNEGVSRFEKRMNFLQSSEAQEVLSNEALLACTIRHQEEKRNTCSTAKSGNCRHFNPLKKKKLNVAHNLISNFTQTANTVLPSGHQVVDTAIQTCNTPPPDYRYSTVEILETSDVSSQCHFTVHQQQEPQINMEIVAADTQTQTDQIDTWLAQLQNSVNLSDMQTQTNLVTPQSICLDKSVQLDDILSGKTWDTGTSIYITPSNVEQQHIPSLFMSNQSLDYKQTISTQTLFNDSSVQQFAFGNQSLDYKQTISTQTLFNDSSVQQFEITTSNDSKISDKDIMLPVHDAEEEPLSMSFGTQTGLDDDLTSNQETLSFGTQTVFENNFFSSSATQTWDAEETSINAKTIETQTAISFSDLLDSSFIDEYLNTDRITSSETQTYRDDHGANKEHVTIETQT